jgi:hypothetical protein
MADQISKNNTAGSGTSSVPVLKKKKLNSSKASTKSSNMIKPDVRFKKVKKISKSIKQIESEMSKIQSQMGRIGKDLTTVLHLIETRTIISEKTKK